jgi:hypothetical protein
MQASTNRITCPLRRDVRCFLQSQASLGGYEPPKWVYERPGRPPTEFPVCRGSPMVPAWQNRVGIHRHVRFTERAADPCGRGHGSGPTRRAMTNEHNQDECRSKIVEHDLLDAHPLVYWSRTRGDQELTLYPPPPANSRIGGRILSRLHLA